MSVDAARPSRRPRVVGARTTARMTTISSRPTARYPRSPRRKRPEDRPAVGHEPVPGDRGLEDPPRVPGPERQDREDLALVAPQRLEVGPRPAVRHERQPQDGHGRGRHEPRPDRPAPAEPGPRPGGERRDERDGLRLGHERDPERDCGQVRPAADREDRRDEPGQDVDRLELAPPGARVDDDRREQHAQGRRDRPARPIAEQVRDAERQPGVGDDRRDLQREAYRQVRGVGGRPEGRLEDPEDPEHVDHDRWEGEIGPIRLPERVGRDPVRPLGEDVHVRPEPEGREQDDSDGDGGGQPQPEEGQVERTDGPEAGGDVAFGRVVGGRRRRPLPTAGSRTSTARRSR